MALYRRGDEWWYHFWYQGQHIQRRTNTASKKEAREKEATHKAQLLLYKQEAEPEENPKFVDFAVWYLEYSKTHKRSYGVEFYYINRTLVPLFGRLRLKEIKPIQVELFKQKRLRDGLKKSSINREIGLLKSMLNRAVKLQLIHAHPAREAELFELDDSSVSDRVLSNEEEIKLLAACDESELRYRAPHLKFVILVALYTGLRRGEILRLRWSDIDFEKNRLRVRKSKTKAGRRHVNLNSMLRAMLLSLNEQEHGEWVFPSPNRYQTPGQPERHIADVKNAFRRAVRLAGIEWITFHQLRHTFCSRLADAGVPLPVIQKLAGHASVTMTSEYTHPADELKQRAVEVLITGPNRAEPATEPATQMLKSPEAKIGETANTSRSII
jgi:integrase